MTFFPEQSSLIILAFSATALRLYWTSMGGWVELPPSLALPAETVQCLPCVESDQAALKRAVACGAGRGYWVTKGGGNGVAHNIPLGRKSVAHHSGTQAPNAGASPEGQ